MTIRQVEVDEYDGATCTVKEGALVVSEFAGQIVLTIKEGKEVSVEWEDLERAWEAVR